MFLFSDLGALIMAPLSRFSNLRGIPYISAWVGSHRWLRILAWWVFPCVFWGLLILGIQKASPGLAYLLQVALDSSANPVWILSLTGINIIVQSAFLIIIFFMPVAFAFPHLSEPSRPKEERPEAGSWVDYLDPDFFLKTPYSQTMVRKAVS